MKCHQVVDQSPALRCCARRRAAVEGDLRGSVGRAAEGRQGHLAELGRARGVGHGPWARDFRAIKWDFMVI